MRGGAPGRTGGAEVRGRSGARVSPAAQLLLVKTQRAAICPGAGGGRARRRAPLTACYRHMLLEHEHRHKLGMVENGVRRSGPLVCPVLS